VREWSEALAAHLPPGTPPDEVATFLEGLGKGCGGGLSDACSASPATAELFGGR
jgi:hypothetical protein